MTGNDIFQAAMSLLGEREAPGGLNESETADFRAASRDIINIMLFECCDADRLIREAAGEGWSGCVPISGLDDTVQADSRLAAGVFPYGLAARLILPEDPARAAYFEQKYNELRASVRRVRRTAIADVYGGVS